MAATTCVQGGEGLGEEAGVQGEEREREGGRRESCRLRVKWASVLCVLALLVFWVSGPTRNVPG